MSMLDPSPPTSELTGRGDWVHAAFRFFSASSLRWGSSQGYYRQTNAVLENEHPVPAIFSPSALFRPAESKLIGSIQMRPLEAVKKSRIKEHKEYEEHDEHDEHQTSSGGLE
jgi:hypothetical protein